MTGEFTVRRYMPSDADRVLTVYESTLEADGWEFSGDPPAHGTITDDYSGITEYYLDVGGEFLVGVTNNEVVATGGSSLETTRPSRSGKWQSIQPTNGSDTVNVSSLNSKSAPREVGSTASYWRRSRR